MKDKECKSCGNMFTPIRKNRRHCYDCDVKTREKRTRQEKVRVVVCACCGDTFQSNFSIARFCSPACHMKYHTKTTSRPEVANCSVCDAEFRPVSNVNKTCSIRCSRRRSYLLGREPNKEKFCDVCKTPFSPRRVLDQCCSAECSHILRRKAQNKKLTCCQCGVNFNHSKQGTPIRCEECRKAPKSDVEKVCDYCGDTFTKRLGEDNRFCGRTCATKGIHAEGLGNSNDPEVVKAVLANFVKTAVYTPTLEDVLVATGYSSTYVANTLRMNIADIFELAGRKNKSLFPSKFEEMVYFAMLELGINNEQIERQKKFSGLYYRHAGCQLRFDFFIRSMNLLVEADGSQHDSNYDEARRYGGALLKECDQRKNAYALEHGLSLVRIPYAHIYKKVLKSASQLLAPLLSDEHSKAI